MVAIAGVVAVAATTGDRERGGVTFGTLFRRATTSIFLRRAARRERMPWTTVDIDTWSAKREHIQSFSMGGRFTFKYDLPVLRFHPVHGPFFYTGALGAFVWDDLFRRRLIVVLEDRLEKHDRSHIVHFTAP